MGQWEREAGCGRIWASGRGKQVAAAAGNEAAAQGARNEAGGGRGVEVAAAWILCCLRCERGSFGVDWCRSRQMIFLMQTLVLLSSN
jgi:hypothetical protein